MQRVSRIALRCSARHRMESFLVLEQLSFSGVWTGAPWKLLMQDAALHQRCAHLSLRLAIAVHKYTDLLALILCLSVKGRHLLWRKLHFVRSSLFSPPPGRTGVSADPPQEELEMPGRLNPGGGAGRTRTGGLVIPNQVRFPLRYCFVNPRIPPTTAPSFRGAVPRRE